MKHKTHLQQSLLVLACSAAIHGAAAQDASSVAQEDSPRRSGAVGAMLEEVIITARRKDNAEGLQSVPVSVSAFSSDQLDAMQFANLTDVTANVPNANAEISSTYPGFVNFNIRGMGIRGTAVSDDPTVGIFIDGVYQGISAGVLIDSFDMESIEILRGPQGTLFGRNVTGGAVLMSTTKPTDEFMAKFKAGAGNYSTYEVSGVVSGPLIEDKLLGKIAIFHKQRDDFIDNINKGKALAPNADDFGELDQQTFRGALTWRVTETLEATVRAEHMQSDQDPLPTDNVPGRTFDADGLNATFGALSPDGIVAAKWDEEEETGGNVGGKTPKSELDSASLDVSWYVGDSKLQSISAWRDFSQKDMQQDFDNSLVPLFEIWDHKIEQDQVSQEFVFNTNWTDKLSMTAGLYYFDQTIENDDFRISGGAFGGTGAHIKYKVDHTVYGVFTSFDYAFTDKLNLTLGGRYTDEEKDATMSNLGAYAASGGEVGCSADGAPAMMFTGVNPKDSIDFSSCKPSFEDDESWNNFTPKVGLQYFINDDAQVYASYSKGFRSGGFSTRALLGTDPLFDEEEMDAYEVGFKLDFAFGGRLNGAIFYNEVSDLQRNIFVSVETGEQVTRNAGDATIQGGELEAWIPLGDNFLIQASIGYTDAEYDDIDFGDGLDYSGNKLPGVAEWQGDVTLIYDYPITGDLNITARAAYHYIDEFYNLDSNEGYKSPDRDTYDASLALSSNSNGWSVTAWGKNLTNENSQGPATDVGVWIVNAVYMPRTYGMELIYQW